MIEPYDYVFSPRERKVTKSRWPNQKTSAYYPKINPTSLLILAILLGFPKQCVPRISIDQSGRRSTAFNSGLGSHLTCRRRRRRMRPHTAKWFLGCLQSLRGRRNHARAVCFARTDCLESFIPVPSTSCSNHLAATQPALEPGSVPTAQVPRKIWAKAKITQPQNHHQT